MNTIFKKALKLVFADDTDDPLIEFSKKNRPLRKLTERELIQLESQIGVTVFGEIPKHVKRREFFNLDETTWVWHEEIIGSDGKTTSELTTRYEVQSKGILKIQPNYHYSYLEGKELQNFVLAVKEYHERVMRQLYHRPTQNQSTIQNP